MRIDDSGYTTYTPPPPANPPPATATTNTQQGTTPQNVTQPTRVNPPAPTPAQNVDLAVARYKAAVASGDQDAISKAKQPALAQVEASQPPPSAR